MLIVGALGSGTGEMSAALTKLGIEVKERDRETDRDGRGGRMPRGI